MHKLCSTIRFISLQQKTKQPTCVTPHRWNMSNKSQAMMYNNVIKQCATHTCTRLVYPGGVAKELTKYHQPTPYLHHSPLHHNYIHVYF